MLRRATEGTPPFNGLYGLKKLLFASIALLDSLMVIFFVFLSCLSTILVPVYFVG